MKIALLMVLALGCKHHELPPPTTDLVVINPGVVPLRTLRYAIAKGTKTAFELATDSRVVADTITQTMPTIALTLEIAIDDVLPDGRMKLRTTVVDTAVGAHPDTAIDTTPIEGQIAPLKSLAITATLSPDGQIAEVALGPVDHKLSDVVSSQLAQLASRFPQLAMPLPSMPVGVGARWRSTRALEQGGMKLTAVATIDVTSLDHDKLGYIMTSELHGPDQTVTIEGVAIDVKNISGTATGHGVVDLATLAITGELTAELHSQMAAQDQPTQMDVSSTITMTPK